MNILFINYEFPPLGGGAGNACSFLSRAFQKRGHEVVILTSAFQEQTGYSNFEGCHLYRIKVPREKKAQASTYEMAAFVFKAWFHLGSIVKKHKIDHAIIFFSIPCGPLGTYLKLRWNIPYINSLRGGDVPGLVRDLDTIHKIITPIRRYVLSKAIATVANADGLANLSRAADPNKIDVIHNGVDASYYHPVHSIRFTTGFHFIFVGRFHEQKNLHYCLKSFKKFVDDYPDCTLHLIGDGPLRGDLEKLSTELNLTEHLKWHGWKGKGDIKKLYQQCHCMINPSHYEGMPNTVLEAMASGLPVIASNIPGNNDLVHDNENGFLFELKHETGLLDCFNKILTHPDVNKLGTKSRDIILKNFSWEIVAEAYEKILIERG